MAHYTYESIEHAIKALRDIATGDPLVEALVNYLEANIDDIDDSLNLDDEDEAEANTEAFTCICGDPNCGNRLWWDHRDDNLTIYDSEMNEEFYALLNGDHVIFHPRYRSVEIIHRDGGADIWLQPTDYQRLREACMEGKDA